MRLFHRAMVCAAIALAVNCALGQSRSDYSGPTTAVREFRGVWVATVGNIDWPSKPGLSSDKQKRELIAILDKCVDLNLNAVIFQVRTEADALYDSKLEPWSEFLSGRMGEAPKPYYDPLKFAIEEAHRRGLQLHAWFNPYRVRVPDMKEAAAANHASIAHPEIVRKYGKYLWFDPGDPAAEETFIAVLNDVVQRYDIDGVHIDDYFYPYQEKDKAGKIIPFPDEETYQRAVAAGATLKRDDWRRQNIDHLIQRMYAEVKKAKPWVLVGISPFGIWRPGNPPGIVGFDAYSTLYADSRKWEREGWLDYLTPQLYWKVESEGQSYPKLLAWWAEQNVRGRHLWPGVFTSKIGEKPKTKTDKSGKKKDSWEKKKGKPEKPWTADDLIRQIEATRAIPGATGNVHFSMKALMQNRKGISDKLKNGLYAEPALVPESPWLGKETPAKPAVSAQKKEGGVAVQMKMPRGTNPWQWLVRVSTTSGWTTTIVPGSVSEQLVPLKNGGGAKAVMVEAISRLGREGPPARAAVAEHQ